MTVQPDPTTLFPPDTTLPKTCSCGAIRTTDCRHQTAIDAGYIDKYARRPRTCLARWNPETAEIPY